MADLQPPDPHRPAAANPLAVPPGWYLDGQALRWWDGWAWGPYAPINQQQNSDDKTFAMISHGGVLIGGFILPLVMYLISDDAKRPNTRFHAREALNFQLTFLAVYLSAFLLMFGGIALSGGFAEQGDQLNGGAVVGLFLTLGVFFIVIITMMVLNFVFSIKGALRANEGVQWKYPFSIRFVRG
jgi:uncharacterized Tic20 family protein